MTHPTATQPTVDQFTTLALQELGFTGSLETLKTQDRILVLWVAEVRRQSAAR